MKNEYGYTCNRGNINSYGNFSLNAHAAIKWVLLNELQKFEFAPADKPFVEKLQQTNI